MPIEDVDYLKQHSQKQSYLFLVNSKDRNKEAYPTPSEYVVDFEQPFYNVIGVNVLDASIPRTMYNIDEYNNTLYFFIHSSNIDVSQITPQHFTQKTIEPGDYTIQTLLDTLNAELSMPLNSNLSSSNVSITVSTLSNPPDIKSRLQFDSAYPFVFDMERSTLAESLGFDTYVQSTEAKKNSLQQNYTIVPSIPPRYQWYHSVDLPYTIAQGTTQTLLEGPRGVIRTLSLSNRIAQRFYVLESTYLSRVYTAFQSSDVSATPSVSFTIQTDLNNEPSGNAISQASTMAISYIDGTLSDSAILSIPLEKETYYWIVFEDTPNTSIYYNDVLTSETTLKTQVNTIWTDVDDLTNAIYYQLSIRLETTHEYHRLKSPGIYSLIGEPYLVIRCKEIEENSYRSLSYTKHQLGIAKIKLGVVGYREERIDFSSIPNREFHPIGRLTRLSLRFETGDGRLYDFKGVNHSITFSIQYYEPTFQKSFERSILNQNYTGDYMGYLYRQEEQEDKSDDASEDYNRDTLEKYRQAESRNLPWQVAQRNIQQFYDLNIDEEEDVAF